ncbi:anti-sigma factor antagonist [Streptomyces sp. NPDC004610]|uniref:anti-sigma factor antagonist n=1 Tax=unclassified Streptomyces TaxID=2593676 RepID=UPI0033A52F7E
MQQDPAPLSRQLRVHRVRGYTVVEFRGEIDIAAAAEIAPHLDAVTARPGSLIVLDLTHIEFFDCSGLRLLYRARTRVLDRDGRLQLVCAHPLTLRVLRVTGLSRLLPPVATLEEATARPGAAKGSV